MNKISHIKDNYMSNPSKVLTLANIISLLRAASAIPIIYTLYYPDLRAVTAGIVILAILSDALDGYFARRAGEVTHLGMWLDPIADFIIITSVVLYLVFLFSLRSVQQIHLNRFDTYLNNQEQNQGKIERMSFHHS